MKKTLIPFFALVLLCMTWLPMRASHEMGVEISYVCQSACTTRILLKAYRDCAGVNAISNLLNWVAPPGCTAPTAISPWSAQVTTEVTPICPSFPTLCNSGSATINGVQEYSWYRDYDICSGTPCTYTLVWSDCCRNPSITSLLNPSSQGIATSGTTINTALGSCNNSPTYTNLPLFYACQGLDYDVHQGAIDIDGDSLVFTMGDCYQAQGTLVAYNPGYSQTVPLGPSWNVTLNPNTGILHLDANPGNAEIGVLCINVAEYRNGSLIGNTQRDIQIVILPCGSNVNPTFAPITNLTGAATAVGDDVYLPAATPFCFDLGTADADPSQTLRLWWEANATSATFIDANGSTPDTVSGTSTAPPVGQFCWTPPSNGTYMFKFRAQDSFCPVYGFGEKIITIHVGACGGATASASSTSCPTVNFTSSTCMVPPLTYAWSGAAGFSSSLPNPSFTYSGPGSYAWQVIVSNGTMADTITGTVTVGGSPSYQSFLSGVHFVAPCTGSLYDTLDAGSWSSYLWSTGATTQQLPVFLGGVYGVTVSAPNGCTYHDSTELYWPSPDIYGIVSTSTGAPLQNQKVLLIQHDTTAQALWAVDSTWTDSAGYYFFCNVTDTLVYLKAAPRILDYPTQMPTYADTTLFSSNAIQFTGVLQAPFRHDFATLYGTNPGGPGFIGGLISVGANKVSAIGDPVPGLGLYLREHNSGAIYAYRVTDANGYFAFAGIPLGEYDIVPDRPLTSTTNVPYVLLDAQAPIRDSLLFQLHHYWLELTSPSVGTPAVQPELQFTASPNPFDKFTRILLNLPTDADVALDVYDVVGKCVAHLATGPLQADQYRFQVGDNLRAGIYFVRLQVNGNERVIKIMKGN